MKKILSLIASLMLGSSLNAGVVAYSQRIVVTRTGGEMAASGIASGWVLLDVETAQLVIITLHPSRGRFRIDSPAQYLVKKVAGFSGRDSAVIAIKGSGTGGLTAKGIISKVFISPGTEFYAVPKTFTVSGSDLTIINGVWILEEYRGSLVNGRWDRHEVNFNGTSMEQALQSARAFYTAKGYIEEVTTAGS